VTKPPVSQRELEAHVADYHHLQEEHRRAGPEGSVRRHLHDRLLELEEEFERLLAEWIEDEHVRTEWREHLHHGAPAPSEPRAARAPLVFKGRSRAGSVCEIRERPDEDLDVLVDGALVERIAGALDFADGAPGLIFRRDHVEFREVFDVPGPALAALQAFVGDPAGEPPWEHAGALLADGLVDRDFALMSRGRRALGPLR